ncbi:MAG: ribonuclease R [Deltaproteobacteria bacterium]|jgi:ribonuclease R|nr:ribonuclease R [Deltaproteobacteria bacterium]
MGNFDLSDILALLQQHASRPLSLREIQDTLDLSAGERKALGKALKDLVKEGSLVQLKGGRFALPKKVNLVVGRLSVHRDGYGFVSPADGGRDDLFIPARHIRPAMHGDLVVARLEHSIRSGRPEGRVIRVEQRAHRLLVGRYRVEHGVGFVLPADTRIQDALLVPPGGKIEVRQDQMVLAEIESYPGRTRGAVGRIREVLGNATDPDVEIRIAAIQFNLPYEFPDAVLAEADMVDTQVSESDLAGREDLRALTFVTIDGETARDFDDAVAIQRMAEGYRLTVAIADVAHYVASGSVTDKEALTRGTSVYFPGSCLPMLPEALSNGICSLKPRVDRLVMAVELDFDARGRRTATRFCEAVIQSRARLTYTEVAAVLVESDPAVREELQALVGDLEVMRELAALRIALRHQRGSLDFDLPEAQIQLDLQGRPENIVRAERNLAHRLIEEFMLAANEAVASWLVQQRKPMVFRVHEAPSEAKMAAFQEFIAHFNQGISIPTEGVTPKLLQGLLERVAGQPEEHVINHVLLRSLPQAYYSTSNLGHFGLAADNYCHFTSPIRRYPDLAVHRILKGQLSGHGKVKADDAVSLDEIASRSSSAERRAMEAERDIVNLKKCQYVADKVGEKYHGMVTSVHAFGLFVELREIFVEGLVHVSSLEDDFYQYEEDRHRLIGMNRRREFTIGTPLQVTVHKVDLDRREIDFRLVDEQKPGAEKQDSRRGKPKPRQRKTR